MKRLWSIAQFALAICIWTGCGGSAQGGGTWSGGVSLSVTITGLPSGTAARVAVTGPAGYNQQLTSTETLEVSQGTYTVTAKPVTQGGAIYHADIRSQAPPG